MWVRGLKRNQIYHYLEQYHVAPRVGAWIETAIDQVGGKVGFVAPRVGAWIETRAQTATENTLRRRTPCGCVD